MSANDFYSEGEQGKYQQSQQQQGQGQQLGQEGGDRGLFSTVVGGAAGAFAGSHASSSHSKLTGTLGALGGAILGNKIEDKFEDRKEHKNQGNFGGQQGGYGGQQGNFGGQQGGFGGPQGGPPGGFGGPHPGLELVKSLSDSLGVGSTKLTGAGGGGCSLTLLKKDASNEQIQKFKTILESTHKYETFNTPLGGIGCSFIPSDSLSLHVDSVDRLFNEPVTQQELTDFLLPGKSMLSWIH